MHSPTHTLALRNPSPTVMRKSIKSAKRASALISRHLGNGTLKSVRKLEDRTIITYYMKGTYSNFRQWAWDYQTAKEIRQQEAKVITVSKSTALVNLIDTPVITLALYGDFAK